MNQVPLEFTEIATLIYVKNSKKERVLWITISKIGVHNGVQKGAQIEMQRERNIICSKRAHKEAQKITEIGF